MLNIVSRGGSLLFAWMSMTGHENPFYEYFDEILKICKEYDVTLSLGDACRPGCLADATDVCQIEELVRLGELAKRAKRAKQYGLQAMIEGPGHVPLNQIQTNMEIQDDLPPNTVRRIVGPDMLIGWSTHSINDLKCAVSELNESQDMQNTVYELMSGYSKVR